MSKELEAWKDIKWFCYKEGKLDKQFELVETALKRLEKYDALNLSCEALQFVSNLLKNPENSTKKVKTFEIIKKKKVNAGEFIDMLEDWPTITYEKWLIYKEENGYYLQDELAELELGIITKEEFDLLKEALK